MSVRRLLDVDLRLLRIFRAVAEHQGLAGAELVLGLSPTRVSAGLAELEARLGVRLCRRGRSGFALTEAGDTVYQASHELFAAVDRFSNRAGAVAEGVRRVLRLGAVDALVTNDELRLPELMRRFRQRLPSAQIDFLTAAPEELERQVLGGRRDLAVVPSLNRRSELLYQPLFAERQSLYCASRHPLACWPGDDVPASALGEHAFVARGYLHSEDLRRIGHRGAEATVETMEAQLILILSGEFIGYLPAHYARPWEAGGELRRLNEPAFGYASPFFAVRTQAAFDNPLVRAFLELLAASPVPSIRAGGTRRRPARS